jgi:hypothetical protein
MKADRLHKFNSLALLKFGKYKSKLTKNMFPALLCSSSERQNCIVQHLVSTHPVGGRPVHSPLSIIVGWPFVLSSCVYLLYRCVLLFLL